MNFFPTLLSISFAAGLQSPPFTLETRPNPAGIEIVALPPAKNHINTDAPMHLLLEGKSEKIKSTQKTEQRTTFLIPNQGPTRFNVSLYLCDDKKTYCENHVVQGTWSGQPTAAPKAPLQKQTHEKATPMKQSNLHGFLLNQPDQALKLAQAQNKPLLIDFFGIWCPPCNVLDAEVFATKKFQAAAKRFITLKLDGDSKASWKMKSQHKIGGYPTVLFANPEGDEIARVVGFYPLDEILRQMDLAWKFKNESFSRLKTKAQAEDPEAVERLGMIHLERAEYDEAARLLAKIPQREEDKLFAEIQMLEKQIDAGGAAQKSTLLAKLEEAIQKFPKTPRSLDLRFKLAPLQESEKRTQTLRDAISCSEELIANPSLIKASDYTPSDIQTLIADAYDELGDAPAAQTAWEKAAGMLQRQLRSDQDRGRSLELAYALWKSGKKSEADALYKKMEKAFPNEFTFYYSHSRTQQEDKNFPEAESLARLALKHSYGDNRLRSTLLLAKVLKAQNKNAEAKTVIDSTLQDLKLPEDPNLRTHKHAKALRDFAASL